MDDLSRYAEVGPASRLRGLPGRMARTLPGWAKDLDAG